MTYNCMYLYALNSAQLIPQYSWLIHQDIDVMLIPNQELAKTLHTNGHVCDEIVIKGMLHDNFPRFAELNLPFSIEIINFIENYSGKDDTR